METDLHKQLKEHGKQLLIQKGFQKPEINTEYEVKIGKMTYFVDVAGVSKTRSTAIECGETPDLKVAHLQAYFDEVVLLPYTALITPTTFKEPPNNEVIKLKKQLAELESQLEKSNNKEEYVYWTVKSIECPSENMAQNLLSDNKVQKTWSNLVYSSFDSTKRDDVEKMFFRSYALFYIAKNIARIPLLRNLNDVQGLTFMSALELMNFFQRTKSNFSLVWSYDKLKKKLNLIASVNKLQLTKELDAVLKFYVSFSLNERKQFLSSLWTIPQFQEVIEMDSKTGRDMFTSIGWVKE